MRDKILECFKALGIIVEAEDNFELQEYIEDSVSFISFIVELESAFGIEITDEYLLPENLRTFDDIVCMIEQFVH